MKRDPRLQTLSWEHHDALVLASRIKKGLENGADPEQIRSYLVAAWEGHMRPHFKAEEEFLLPFMNFSAEAEQVTARVLADHRSFDELVAEIQAGGHRLPEMLKQFVEMLRSHVRLEERELFPAAESGLSQTCLEEMSIKLVATYEENVFDKDAGVSFWK